MRKAVKLLALTTLTAALCATLTGCEAVKDATIGENPVKTATTRNAPTICAGARLCHIWVTAWQSLQRTALR